jgi:hypothetical protein
MPHFFTHATRKFKVEGVGDAQSQRIHYSSISIRD